MDKEFINTDIVNNLSRLYDSIYSGTFGEKLLYYNSIFEIKVILGNIISVKHNEKTFFIIITSISDYNNGGRDIQSINEMFNYFEILDRNRKLKDITNDL